MEGFLNLRGIAIPVIRLDRLFELPVISPGLYTHLVILNVTHPPVALMVDRVTDIRKVSTDALLPVPEQRVFNDCVEALVSGADGEVHLVLPDRLLLEEERRRVAELQALEQERLRALE